MKKVAYLFAILVLLSYSAWAGQIAFGATPAIASGSGTVYQNETHDIGSGSSFWMTLKGNAVSTEPILLIIGIPNDTGALLSSSLSATLYNSTLTASFAGTVSTSGTTGYGPSSAYKTITKHDTLGYAGSFSSGDLYGNFFGISSITNSQQFKSNWQAWDQALFPAIYPPPNQPMNFGIYVYALSFSGGDFSAKGDNYIQINLPGGLPLGSYAVGYSVDAKTVGKQTMTDNFTPFTTAGIVTRGVVPEPASILLLGSGLSAAGFWMRRKR